VTFLGWLGNPFQGLSDLQLGDEKVTLNHLAWVCIKQPRHFQTFPAPASQFGGVSGDWQPHPARNDLFQNVPVELKVEGKLWMLQTKTSWRLNQPI